MKVTAHKQNNVKQAALLMLCGALAFSVMMTFAKLAAQNVPAGVIIFSRYLIGVSYILLLLGVRKINGHKVKLKTRYLRFYILLALAALATLMLLYYALNYISLLDATLLNTTYPLFMPILTVALLGRRTPIKVWLGLIVGFVGIACILKPSPMIFNPIALLALASGVMATLAVFLIRQLSKREEHYRLMFYFFVVSAIGGGIIAFFYWQTPSVHDLWLLLGVGVFGVAYLEFLIRASRHAQARIISSLMYFNIVFSGILGWFIWHNLPDELELIGIVLICIGSVYTLFQASHSDMSRQIFKK